MTPKRSSVPPQIVDEASSWFVSMREPSVSAENHEAFAEWLRASPVHVGVYLEIARLWVDASQVDVSCEVESIAKQWPNVVALREGRDSFKEDLRPTEVGSRRRYATAAAALFVCCAAGSLWWYANRVPAYATEIGEQRVITLEEGSTVRLNSRSKFKVRLSSGRREIELVAGQALFDVTQDKSRPFIVRSGDVAIRAVGTQFDVNRKSSGTVVTVVEGKVAIVPKEGGAEVEATLLAAGEQARVATTGAVQRTENANTVSATSWLQQELVFDGQLLSEVVEELNRYTRTPIVLTDPSLARLRINAVFHTTSPDSFLRYVARFDGVQIERSAHEIRLVRAAADTATAEKFTR